MHTIHGVRALAGQQKLFKILQKIL